MSLRSWLVQMQLALALVLACGVAVAARSAPPVTSTMVPTTAASTGTPWLLPVADFARHAQLGAPRLSPDGKLLMVRFDSSTGNNHSLVIFRLANMSKLSTLNMPVNQVPVDPVWVDDEWIALDIGDRLGSLDEPSDTGQVIAANVNGSRQRYLFGWDDKALGPRSQGRNADEGMGFIVGVPETPNGHLYVRAEPFGHANRSILYDIDVRTNARREIADMHVYGMQFLLDRNDKPAYAFGNNADFKYVVYRNTGADWVELGKKQLGDYFEPIAFAPDNQHVYAEINPDGGPTQLVSEALDGSQRSLLAADAFASVGDVQWTAVPERPFAVMPEAGIPHAVLLDPGGTAAKLYRGLQKAFPNELVDFINFDQDGGKLLFYVSSDRDPGTYYLLDTHTYKAAMLFHAAPWIKPALMATRQPFRFKASDGTELEGILTVPLHRQEHHLPMVLLPHGGPYGIRDSWGFDWDAQFLANRGYLVLQVNYRGSAGRGVNFSHSGYRKWGSRIQQDLIDGVKWAIAQHYADPNRICVYGGSFGGYSAMMTVIRAPHMFKCAVGYSGIYDLQMMYRKGDIQSSRAGTSYLGTVLGHDSAVLAANSPDKLADKIDVPVFLAHGKDDQRAPFAQAEAMRDALEAAHKKFEWMAVSHEGHGFYTEADEAAFLNRLQAFLAKYIGPGAPPVN